MADTTKEKRYFEVTGESYELKADGESHRLYTLVSKNGVVAFRPDNENQRIFDLFRESASQPVRLHEVTREDTRRIIKLFHQGRTKKDVPLENILGENIGLDLKMLQDFEAYATKIS